MRFAWVPEYSDYLPERPGGRVRGRSVEPVPMDARFLGDELGHLHPPYTKAPANLIVTQADFRKISLGMRTIRGPLTMVKVVVSRIVNSLRGRKMYAMGNALAIGLRQGLVDAGVPVGLRHRAARPARRGRPGRRRDRAARRRRARPSAPVAA